MALAVTARPRQPAERGINECEASLRTGGVTPESLETTALARAATTPEVVLRALDATTGQFPTRAGGAGIDGEPPVQLGDRSAAERSCVDEKQLTSGIAQRAAGAAETAIHNGDYQGALEALRPALHDAVPFSLEVLRALETIVRRGNCGGEELLHLVAIRGRALAQLTSPEKIGNLHRLAQLSLGRGVDDGGPGTFARSPVDRLVHRSARPVNRVAARVAPRPDDGSDVG